MIYTGIGARKTPSNIISHMRELARLMADAGHTLRSGGAEGADEAFENGCIDQSGKMEIYLPWRGFRGNPSDLGYVTEEARNVAKQFHPYWHNLREPARNFMGRNGYQVLGLDLKTPTDLVICWTPDGKVAGGTGQALRMAQHYRIPILNFGSMSVSGIDRWMTMSNITKFMEK